MGFKKAINIVPFWNTKELTEGSVLEGIYQSSEVITGKFGEQVKYIIAKADGETVAVAGTASIMQQFANVPEGSLVRITYKGIDTTKSGNTVKVYEVEYDDSNI